MNLELLTEVVLAHDPLQHHPRRGDMAKIVDRHPGPDGSAGHAIEVFNAPGETILVATAPSAASPRRSTPNFPPIGKW